MSDNHTLITELFKKYVKGYINYSISLDQASYIADGISELKPARFLEIGTCTGTSTGYIANVMHAHSGRSLVSLDLLSEWKSEEKGDAENAPMRSKKIGHMIPIMYSEKEVKVLQHTGCNSSVLISKYQDNKFHMGFIDASHVHPWTTLDTIAALPCFDVGSRVYYHDVNLHRVGKVQHSRLAIGVKHLFDQIHPDHKDISYDNGYRNIGYITIPEVGFKELIESIIDSLYIPWTTPWRIGHSVIISYAKLARDYWSIDLAEALLECANRYNPGQQHKFTLADLD